MMWTLLRVFSAEYGEFVSGQRVGEGGVKSAPAVNFPPSIVQGQGNAQSFSGTSFRTFPIAMVLPSSLKVNRPI